MTILKKKNGNVSPTKITLFCTIAATAATCIIAMPTALDYFSKAASPWTSLPTKIDSIQHDVKIIKMAMPMVDFSEDQKQATNKFAQTRK